MSATHWRRLADLDPSNLDAARTARRPRIARAWLALAVMLGFGLGVGGFTFHYAEGASYLSTDPRACVNCHIMRPQYDAWQKGSHHAVATCADCHIPATGIAKWISKASNGFYHSKGFTLQDFPEPIRIARGNPVILQDNCLRCHADLLHDQVAGSTSDRDAIQCVHCHRDVGHGEQAGLGGRDRGEAHERTEGHR